MDTISTKLPMAVFEYLAGRYDSPYVKALLADDVPDERYKGILDGQEKELDRHVYYKLEFLSLRFFEREKFTPEEICMVYENLRTNRLNLKNNFYVSGQCSYTNALTLYVAGWSWEVVNTLSDYWRYGSYLLHTVPFTQDVLKHIIPIVDRTYATRSWTVTCPYRLSDVDTLSTEWLLSNSNHKSCSRILGRRGVYANEVNALEWLLGYFEQKYPTVLAAINEFEAKDYDKFKAKDYDKFKKTVENNLVNLIGKYIIAYMLRSETIVDESTFWHDLRKVSYDFYPGNPYDYEQATIVYQLAKKLNL